MSSTDTGASPQVQTLPSMLDVMRLSPRKLFPPGGVELYRQIAILTDMRSGTEVLDVASGRGVPLEYWVSEFGVNAAGIDIDPSIVDAADSWSRDLEAGDRLQFQSASSDSLPYRDDIFDVTIGEIGLTNHCDPEEAIREMVRVTNPGGFVVLVQFIWKAPVDVGRRAVLSDRLGVTPMIVAEWKRILREAGVEGVHIEDWSGERTAFGFRPAKPFANFWETLTLAERLLILRRAWKRWGLRGVWTTLSREREARRLLISERIIGLNLIRGRKEGAGLFRSAQTSPRTHEKVSVTEASVIPELPLTETESNVPLKEVVPDQEIRIESDGEHASSSEKAEDQPETAGLPLFGELPARGKE